MPSGQWGGILGGNLFNKPFYHSFLPKDHMMMSVPVMLPYLQQGLLELCPTSGKSLPPSLSCWMPGRICNPTSDPDGCMRLEKEMVLADYKNYRVG